MKLRTIKLAQLEREREARERKARARRRVAKPHVCPSGSGAYYTYAYHTADGMRRIEARSFNHAWVLLDQSPIDCWGLHLDRGDLD